MSDPPRQHRVGPLLLRRDRGRAWSAWAYAREGPNDAVLPISRKQGQARASCTPRARLDLAARETSRGVLRGPARARLSNLTPDGRLSGRCSGRNRPSPPARDSATGHYRQLRASCSVGPVNFRRAGPPRVRQRLRGPNPMAGRWWPLHSAVVRRRRQAWRLPRREPTPKRHPAHLGAA